MVKMNSLINWSYVVVLSDNTLKNKRSSPFATITHTIMLSQLVWTFNYCDNLHDVLVWESANIGVGWQSNERMGEPSRHLMRWERLVSKLEPYADI